MGDNSKVGCDREMNDYHEVSDSVCVIFCYFSVTENSERMPHSAILCGLLALAAFITAQTPVNQSHDHTSHESHDHTSHESHDHTNGSHVQVQENATSSEERAKAEMFLQELFNKYGRDGLMTFEGFEHLLENIGLAQISIHDHNILDHHAEGEFKVRRHERKMRCRAKYCSDVH